MKTFELKWSDGRTEILCGDSIQDAYSRTGRDEDGIALLDSWKEIKEIPLDINKVEVPLEVELSKLASQISDACRDQCIQIPQELKTFVAQHDNDGAGYDWECRLLDQAYTMSTPLLQQWVNTVKGHMCRAEMRAELKRRPDYIPPERN